jgi:hypothetical protein
VDGDETPIGRQISLRQRKTLAAIQFRDESDSARDSERTIHIIGKNQFFVVSTCRFVPL